MIFNPYFQKNWNNWIFDWHSFLPSCDVFPYFSMTKLSKLKVWSRLQIWIDFQQNRTVRWLQIHRDESCMKSIMNINVWFTTRWKHSRHRSKFTDKKKINKKHLPSYWIRFHGQIKQYKLVPKLWNLVEGVWWQKCRVASKKFIMEPLICLFRSSHHKSSTGNNCLTSIMKYC